MPFERFWQREPGKFDVQYPAPSCAGRTRRSMQQQRTHQQNVTRLGLTKNLLMSFTAVLNRVRV